MAKNKQRGKKQQNVFQVANKQSKPKTKTKPVKTSLKHINTMRNEKVESLNQMFTEVQRDVKSISKPTSSEPKKVQKVVREAPREAVNVDNAAELFSQL
ncbi:Phthiocerol phenolphthiocerol synthesis polyketide synthase type I [Labeo rohita]|uniref:Phthiocerol phenolphthiocerol synthesis polyketide synthase type I n=1 Tax=Labeo rohita TaxID=84645 RepID=A0A498N726_LABRO|nr:ribosomal biogenesis factor [Labeo rohita]RXN24695.1 Phthiocerol phenolphthiocerol synthesis polyketide synthase type I [Labeo rohita]